MSAGVVTVYAVVAAIDDGRQLGEDTPTAFVGIAGRTILERCLDGLAASHEVDRTVVSVSAEMQVEAEELLASQAVQWAPMTVSVVVGGVERADSVLAALESIERDVGDQESRVLVAVHDAARCLTPPAAIAGLVRTACEGVANNAWTGVVPVVPVPDTAEVTEVTEVVKAVEVACGGAADGAEVIRSAPVSGVPPDGARGGLHAAQTPQVFAFDRLLAANRMQQAREELDSAHPTGEPPSAHSPIEVVDDSSLMEMAGETVVVVPGSDLAFTISGPADVVQAERLATGGNK